MKNHIGSQPILLMSHWADNSSLPTSFIMIASVISALEYKLKKKPSGSTGKTLINWQLLRELIFLGFERFKTYFMFGKSKTYISRDITVGYGNDIKSILIELLDGNTILLKEGDMLTVYNDMIDVHFKGKTTSYLKHTIKCITRIYKSQ